MDARLQRRIQRYGWDLAADEYEPLWGDQLASAQALLLERVALRRGERVLDVACGTGVVLRAAAHAVGDNGRAVGIDISAQMVAAAATACAARGLQNVEFARMDAEALEFSDQCFDVVLCSLGLMYMPDAEQAIREMHRVLRPGGRIALLVWGDRRHCGWADVFEIVQDEVRSEVCPLFFRLGQHDALERACRDARFVAIEQSVMNVTLEYPDAQQACRAAFVGGPVALAWARFDEVTRARVMQRYVASIERWRDRSAYRIPGGFRIALARRAAAVGTSFMAR